MRLLIVVHSSMFDACLPLIKRLRNKAELFCVFEVYPHTPNMMEVSNKDFGDKDCVKGSKIESLIKYSDYIPLDNTLVIKFYRPSEVIKHIHMMHLLDKYVKTVKPDFVYFYNVDSIALLFSFSSKYKWGMAVHDPILHSSEKNAFFHQMIRRILFYKCHSFFLFSATYLNEFSHEYNIPTQNIHLTALGAYEQIAIPNSSEEHKGLNLLFFGRIEQYKGLKYLLASFKLLREKYDDIYLHVLGKGYIETDIIDLNNPGLNIVNRFYTVEEFRETISKCDLVVCPYTDATQSGVIMSSYAFRKPVVATKVGGLSEMVTHLKTGYLIDTYEPHVIFNAIDFIYHNKGLLKEWSLAIDNEYGENGEHGWNCIADKLIENINDLIIQK